MSVDRNRIEGVATNIVTGFLGAGKTTAILHLLKQKPAHERWAVLVNEFGEVGIDGSLLAGSSASAGDRKRDGIFFREVPGGCMCCTAGLPMQVALNTLLQQSRPHRLLIEPTGLGHPREVLETLGEEHYREVLDLRATVTLVDPRKVRDDRYTSHETFVQQLDVADVIVANKGDVCDATDFAALESFLRDSVGLERRSLFQVEHGALDPTWLDPRAARYALPEPDPHGRGHHHHDGAGASDPRQAPPGGHVRIDNEGDGYFSAGWIFDASIVFEAGAFRDLLLRVDAERAKGVVITTDGITAFNMADGVLKEFDLDESLDSRLEFIAENPAAFAGLEEALLACASDGASPSAAGTSAQDR